MPYLAKTITEPVKILTIATSPPPNGAGLDKEEVQGVTLLQIWQPSLHEEPFTEYRLFKQVGRKRVESASP